MGGSGLSVLLTTRNFTVATTIAAGYVQVNALADEDGGRMLLKVIEGGHATPADSQHALAISRRFGGLPLALAQIGGFVTQRKLSLQEVLPLYERYSTKIDARKAPGSDYEHTLSSVRNVSFEKLTETPTHLLYLLSFFDPDGISETILLQGSQRLEDTKFSFLCDELESVACFSSCYDHRYRLLTCLPSFGDAVEELIRGALVNRAGESATLTIHRLVQSAARISPTTSTPWSTCSVGAFLTTPALT
jgi:hypothetical protein